MSPTKSDLLVRPLGATRAFISPIQNLAIQPPSKEVIMLSSIVSVLLVVVGFMRWKRRNHEGGGIGFREILREGREGVIRFFRSLCHPNSSPAPAGSSIGEEVEELPMYTPPPGVPAVPPPAYSPPAQQAAASRAPPINDRAVHRATNILMPIAQLAPPPYRSAIAPANPAQLRLVDEAVFS